MTPLHAAANRRGINGECVNPPDNVNLCATEGTTSPLLSLSLSLWTHQQMDLCFNCTATLFRGACGAKYHEKGSSLNGDWRHINFNYATHEPLFSPGCNQDVVRCLEKELSQVKGHLLGNSKYR